jgi:integrase
MFEQTESQKTAAANELKHLSESELIDVLECARKTSSRDHALLVVAYTHGLRNQEVARLRLADLNWKSQEITINRLKCSLNTGAAHREASRPPRALRDDRLTSVAKRAASPQ